jgi:hypothetical protein
MADGKQDFFYSQVFVSFVLMLSLRSGEYFFVSTKKYFGVWGENPSSAFFILIFMPRIKIQG